MPSPGALPSTFLATTHHVDIDETGSNTCVLNTSFTAFNFDYRVVVLSDCVASMYGDDLHVLGLQNVARCLGWVITNEQLFEKLGSAEIQPRAVSS